MSLASLSREFEPWARWLYETAQFNGLLPRVTSTYRSRTEQARLYDRYRRGLSRYPAAPPGHSLHEYGRAIDMTVRSQQQALGEFWERYGMRWGGRFNDPVHYDTGW